MKVARVVLNSAHAGALAGFYQQALGFERDERRGDVIALALGATRLDLRRVEATARPYPPDVAGWDPRFQHCALVVDDMDSAMASLRGSSGWTPISVAGPERLPPNTGGVIAFKFRDPDGHPLELLWLPDAADREPPRIDHTALSVADVERSIAFYAELGWRATARTHNVGSEQSRLDAVADASVDVVTLQRTGSTTGPHLELLGYRGRYDRSAPPPGPDDVAATCIVFAIGAGEYLPTVTRDPDGHLLAFERASD